MADLFKASGGAKAQGNLPETWTAPASLFDTTDRNDGSVYSWNAATSTVTLPSSGLADGYLLVGAFEYHDTSNGRFTPQGKFVQASGTGNFVGGPSAGYNRDTSEDRSYVRAWAIVDNPSASATFQFQWKADADDSTGGTERSEIQVIPLYYSNIGMYTSTSAALYGGTTPNQVTGFTADHESDTAAIEISSNVITVKGDNKRYLVFGSQFFEGRGGRTQRWHGLRIDGTKEDAAKAYSYYRNTSNDEVGEIFTYLIDRATTDITIDQFCYRGDGVSAGQGGADIDGSTPSVGDHATVVIELNDSAEVFRGRDTNESSNYATTGPIDCNIGRSTDIEDTASFTNINNTQFQAEQDMDVLLGANISAASGNISTGNRWTAYSEFTIGGVEQTDSFAGDYLRNNQSSQDTFGWSANLLGFLALTSGEDVGVSVTELSGSEGAGGGPVTSPAGWSGMWGVNLDTLEDTGGPTAANDERDAEIHGVDTANAERDAEIDGQDSANAERDAEVTGVSTWKIERNADGAGWVTIETAIQIEETAGTFNYTDTGRSIGVEYCYRVTNVDPDASGVSNTDCATPTGTQTNDERDAEIHGVDTANAERDAEIEGIDPINYAAKFDGDDSQITVPDNNFDGLNNGTIEFRFKVPPTTTFQKFLFKNGAIDLGINNNGDVFGEIVGVGNVGIVGSGEDDNAWHHFALSWDGSDLRAYIDGAYISKVTQSGTQANNGNTLYIGRRETTEPFAGLIDDLRISDIARYTTETSFTVPTDEGYNDENTLLHYRFNTGSGTSVTDESGNGNTGTMANGVEWLEADYGDASQEDERDAEISGSLGANDERDAEIDGVDTANDERDAEITGQLTANDERDAEIDGVDTANAERSAEIDGQDTANAERDAEIDGADSANAERDAEIDGVDTAGDERDAEIDGQDTANAERDAEIDGVDGANAERDAEIDGQDFATDERDAEIDGIEATTDERDAEISGVDTANDERDAEIHGQLSDNAERDAEIDGADGANAERDAEIDGVDTIEAERDAEITGSLDTNDERDAEIDGALGAEDERDAEITGIDTTEDERSAEITGQLSTSDERDAEVSGIEGANDERDAEITGQDSTEDERDAEITGSLDVNDERDAEIDGQAAAAGERDAEIDGQDTAGAERNAQIDGQDSANAERNAQIDGQDSAGAERSAEVDGIAGATGERDAEITGSLDSQDERDAEIFGALGASAERGAEISGTLQNPYCPYPNPYSSKINPYSDNSGVIGNLASPYTDQTDIYSPLPKKDC